MIAQQVNNHKKLSKIVVVSHQLETLVIVTSPSRGLYRYLIGIYEDSLKSREHPWSKIHS